MLNESLEYVVNNETFTLCGIKSKQVRRQSDILGREQTLGSNPSFCLCWFYKLGSTLDVFLLFSSK